MALEYGAIFGGVTLSVHVHASVQVCSELNIVLVRASIGVLLRTYRLMHQRIFPLPTSKYQRHWCHGKFVPDYLARLLYPVKVTGMSRQADGDNNIYSNLKSAEKLIVITDQRFLGEANSRLPPT